MHPKATPHGQNHPHPVPPPHQTSPAIHRTPRRGTQHATRADTHIENGHGHTRTHTLNAPMLITATTHGRHRPHQAAPQAPRPQLPPDPHHHRAEGRGGGTESEGQQGCGRQAEGPPPHMPSTHASFTGVLFTNSSFTDSSFTHRSYTRSPLALSSYATRSSLHTALSSRTRSQHTPHSSARTPHASQHCHSPSHSPLSPPPSPCSSAHGHRRGAPSLPSIEPPKVPPSITQRLGWPSHPAPHASRDHRPRYPNVRHAR